MSRRPRVLLTRRWPAAAEAAIAAKFDVTLNESDAPLGADDLRRALAEYDAVAPTVSDALPAEVLKGAKARILANYGVGFSHIDVAAAKAQGLVVTNTPGVLTDCTADLAMGLLLSAARRIGEGEREVRAGGWSGWRPNHMVGGKVSGATLGVIGFGRIGQAVAWRAHHGFGMRVIFHDSFRFDPALAETFGAKQCDTVEQVLGAADFVTLHCPGGAENRHLINAARLALMKPTAYLINTARGEIVDEAALAEALAARRIAGAGLDVYENEPRVHPALLGLENVVLAPHLGSASEATRVAMGMKALANLTAFFEGAEPPDRVA